MSASPRWNVEVAPHRFEDVGAASLSVEGGCLVFQDDKGKVVVAYATGTWLTVSEGEA